MAQRQANKEPRERGELKKTKSPALAERITRLVLLTKRTHKGSEIEPPESHVTEPPVLEKLKTLSIADDGAAPMPSELKAAKQRTIEGGIVPGVADNKAASAPEQQPTTKK